MGPLFRATFDPFPGLEKSEKIPVFLFFALFSFM
jgi:hypothetical protein